jgi:uncharacterized protein (DUF1330 family)
MSAYLLVDCKVTDPVKYEAYKLLAKPAVERHGGRYLVRGGETAVLEGDWRPNRVILVEFPTLAQARAFYDSPEYAQARATRTGAAEMNMIAVAGV